MGNIGFTRKRLAPEGRDSDEEPHYSKRLRRDYDVDLASFGDVDRLSGKCGFLLFLKEKLVTEGNRSGLEDVVEDAIAEYNSFSEVDKDVWKVKQMYVLNDEGEAFTEGNALRNFLLELRKKIPHMHKSDFVILAFERFRKLKARERVQYMDRDESS